MERLISLYNIASPSGKEKAMIKYILSELKRMNVNYTVDRLGNIYAVKGRKSTYPCIVAHTDEVHTRKTGTYGAYVVNDSMIVGYHFKQKKMTGIGADDKNGIWICLKCLEEFKVMKCVFFVREEVGCIGSRNADMDFFSDCRYVLQCDRKGNRDLITKINGTSLCSEEFIETISPGRFGYSITQGLSTDVHTLKQNGLEVSCVNISCGYYEPHTDREYTIIDDLYKCYRFVRHIILCHREVSRHIPASLFYESHWERFGMEAFFRREQFGHMRKGSNNSNIVK